jgi:hypothetical protein
LNSKMKGKNGELEFVHELIALGIEARRSQQFSGANGDADIITPGVPVFWEVKRCQNLNLHEAMIKAKEQCENFVPCIGHRKNRTDWLLTIRLSDVFEFINAIKY